LLGTEIKSMRKQSPNMRDAFVEIVSNGTRFEAFLCNLHIGPYSHGNIWNHEPLRKRRLLLHTHQLKKLYGAVIQKGMTIVPLRIYLKKGMAKVEIALGKGKKLHDKRNTIRQKSVDREISRAMKRDRK
jgi:SsrA-binding protein